MLCNCDFNCWTIKFQPRFLYRNLSYMKNRVPRPHNPNRKFSSIDSLLQQKTKLLEDQRVKSILTKNLNFLNIIVIGFYDGQTCEFITAFRKHIF